MTRYKVEQQEVDESHTESVILKENKNTENIKLIDKFTVNKKPEQNQENPEGQGQKINEILDEFKNKPRITDVQIIKRSDDTPIKRTYAGNGKRRRISSDSDKDEGESKKELRRDESRQSPLAGEMKPGEIPTASRQTSRPSSRASSGTATPVRLTTDSVVYRTGPRGRKFPVIRLKRADKDKDNKDDPEPGPSWRN